jgi:hypothetical protein
VPDDGQSHVSHSRAQPRKGYPMSNMFLDALATPPVPRRATPPAGSYPYRRDSETRLTSAQPAMPAPQAAKDPAAMLASALELVKAAGYRVNKPRAVKATTPNGLNAIGKPYSEHFDPAYRMKYKTSRRVACAGTSTAAGSQARTAYRAAMERKHAGNPAVFAEVCARQGVSWQRIKSSAELSAWSTILIGCCFRAAWRKKITILQWSICPDGQNRNTARIGDRAKWWGGIRPIVAV